MALPIKPQWTLSVQGKRVTLHEHRSKPPIKRDKSRGVITTFSKAARRRMLFALAAIRWHDCPHGTFLTLTYHDERSDHTMKERGSHRSQLHRFIENHVGDRTPAVWKVEWKRRLTGDYVGEFRPHMHILFFKVTGLDKSVILDVWQRIIRSPNTTQVDLQETESSKMAALYAAKYCAQTDELYSLDNVSYQNKVGRHVGWLRKELIPWYSESRYENVPNDLVDWMKKRAHEKLEWYNMAIDGGFTFLGELADELRKDLGTFGVDDGSELL